MLYEAEQAPNLRWMYWTLGGAGGLVLVLAGWIAPLVNYNRRLKNSEKKYRELAERAPFPVTISDVLTGRFIFANGLAGAMLKVAPGELVGRQATEFYIEPEKRAELLGRLGREDTVSDQELWLRDQEGRTLWVLLSASQIDFGGRRGLVAAFQDITHRREMEGELRRAKEAAESANAARNRYLAMMAHDIRTPMNGIIGMTELMLSDRDSPLADEHRDNMGLLRVASRSLLKLVNELLDWSQLEEGAMKVEAAPLHLREELEPLVGLFRPGAEAKGVDLSLSIEEGVPDMVWTDPLRLRQILSNLLSNAVKFTASGRVEVAVTAVPRDPAQDGEATMRLRFRVSDTGPGIPEAMQARLFTAYAQADATVARRYGGSGLGLSISRQLTRLLGGDITLDSREGAGSVFTVEIRVRTEAGDATAMV
jgi:PAS domain S-box-containing protein